MGQMCPWMSYATRHGQVCPTFQSHVIMIEKLGEPTFKTNDRKIIFDVALNRLDLKQNGSWIMDLSCSCHVSMDPNVFFSLNLQRIPITTMVQTSRNQILPIEGKYTINFGSQGEINIMMSTLCLNFPSIYSQ